MGKGYEQTSQTRKYWWLSHIIFHFIHDNRKAISTTKRLDYKQTATAYIYT